MLCGRFCPPRLAWPARCPSSRQPAVAQAHRLPALIAGNAVVIKQGSDHYEHFHKALRPWHHCIPVARDLSDLDQKLAWAKANDAQARAIGGNARSLAREHLRMEDVHCCHVMAFTVTQKPMPSLTSACFRTTGPALTCMQPDVALQSGGLCQCWRLGTIPASLLSTGLSHIISHVPFCNVFLSFIHS